MMDLIIETIGPFGAATQYLEVVPSHMEHYVQVRYQLCVCYVRHPPMASGSKLASIAYT